MHANSCMHFICFVSKKLKIKNSWKVSFQNNQRLKTNNKREEVNFACEKINYKEMIKNMTKKQKSIVKTK